MSDTGASCWALTPSSLESLAVRLLGPRPGGWVRQGANYALIANVRYGSLANRIPEELSALAAEARAALANPGPDTALRVASAWHLRFTGGIHPLRDGNGRVARHLLAVQLQEAAQIPAPQTISRLHASVDDYRRVYASQVPMIMHQALVDLLARLTGIAPTPQAYIPPFRLEPLYRQPGSPITDGRSIPPDKLRAAKRDFASVLRGQHTHPAPGGRPFWQKSR